MSFALSQDHQCGVNCDARKPCGESSPAIEGLDMYKCPHPCILHRVFGVFPVSCYPKHRTKCLLLAANGKPSKCQMPFAYHRNYQTFISRSIQLIYRLMGLTSG
jgi:hypothetical protein